MESAELREKAIADVAKVIKLHNRQSPVEFVKNRIREPETMQDFLFSYAVSQRELVLRLAELITLLRDPDPCEYDHHGYCQAHSLDLKPCPHELAKELLKGISK